MLLNDKLTDYRLLLASHSPRRQQLLRDCGLRYTLIDKYEVEEVYPPDCPVEGVAEYLSQLKSAAYPQLLAPCDILLTADTVVLTGDSDKAAQSDGQILGKPRDRQDALRMLRLLSGAVHRVITGVTLRSEQHTRHFSVTTRVWFRPLAEEEIAYYLDTFRPYDKAGSYGIQEWIGYTAIERIEGSFYNVMGLPIQRVYTELEKFLTL